jgi:hypothetical protein
MFDLKRPCMTCPFRIGQGSRFALRRDRLREIFTSPAFQCHKGVVYGEDEEGESTTAPGARPQQCAGLMAVLIRAGRPNQIMRIAMRLGSLDPKALDPRNEAYLSLRAAFAAHAGREP